MKTIFKMVASVMAVGALMVGCMDEKPNYLNNGDDPNGNGDNVGAVGTLVLSSMKFDVVTEEDLNPGQYNAPVSLDDYTIEIINEEDEVVESFKYGERKDESIELPIGAYTLTALSAPIEDMAWEAPQYSASKEFTIRKDQATELNDVVCTLANIKVTVAFSADLSEMLDDASYSTVVLGDSEATFVKDESRAIYFRAVDQLNTLDFTLNGIFVDTQKNVGLNTQIKNVMAGQWRNIKLVIEHAADGNIDFTIIVDNFTLDEEVTVNTSTTITDAVIDESVLMQPSIAFEGYDFDEVVALRNTMFDKQGNCIEPFTFKAEVPYSIASYEIAISSDVPAILTDLAAAGVDPTFDLCANSATSEMGAAIKGFGFAVGAEVAGQRRTSFDIGALMALFYKYEGNHSVAMTITDKEGNSVSETANFSVASKITLPPVIEWLNYDITQKYELQDDMEIKIEVTADSGIKAFKVDIISPVLTPEELAGVGLSDKLDLVNPGEFESGLQGLGFPTGDQVENQTYVSFDITQFVPILNMLGTGDHQFKLTVTDNEDRTTIETLQVYHL